MRVRSLRELASTMALAASLATAVVMPAGYALMSHTAESGALGVVAQLSAARAGRYVYQHGSLWTFHQVRLVETISLPAEIHATVRQGLFDARGNAIARTGEPPAWPTHVVSAAVRSRDSVVGRLDVETSLRPLIGRTALVGFLSTLLAGGLYLSFRRLPLRALDDAIDKLDRREAELAQANERFEAALASMPIGVSMFGVDHRLQLCNAHYRRMYGMSDAEAAPGVLRSQMMTTRDARGAAPVDVGAYETWIADLLKRREPSVREWRLADGRTIRLGVAPVASGGMISMHEDVTAINEAKARIAHMAHHDALTNLPNRALFRLEAEKALAETEGSVAVMAIDLDRFKEVNDTYGHPVGDQLLVRVAERLTACLGAGEIVARLGGDEFAVITCGENAMQRAAALGATMIQRAGEAFEIDGRRLYVGASIGVAIAPADGRNPDDLFKAADIALYRAKSEGRGACRFFEAEMDQKMAERRRLEADLSDAIAAGELEMHYQPLVSLATNRINAVEALMRWRSPTHGQVSPAVFIPLAEQSGAIGRLGAWALRQSCADAMAWPDDVRVAVNVSAEQLRSDALVLDVVSALSESGLPARRLEIEITESVLMQDTEATLAKLKHLRGLGVHVAMDDFGTGYSSLSYLRRFPFDRLKIDQFFIRDLPEREDAAAIVRAIIGLGHSLGMDVTAEGVETPAQLARLRAEGCTDVQGWLFSKARPRHEITALLEARDRSMQAA